MTVLSERIYNPLDAGGDTRAIALDISNAFDKVWHGVVGPILSILESYLQERSLNVVLDGQSPPLYITNAGVPQGSVLGPTLYLVFIIDLPDEVISRIGIYADDTTLHFLRRWNLLVNLLALACSTSVTMGNVPLSLRISYLSDVSLLDALAFLSRCTAALWNSLWNSLTNECFPPDYDLTAFKGRVNKFLLLK